MPTVPYRPSNGTEGEAFYAATCRHCAHMKRARANGDGCDIYLRAMAYSWNDPNYPREWVTDAAKGPRCTSFAETDRTQAGPQEADPRQGMLL